MIRSSPSSSAVKKTTTTTTTKSSPSSSSSSSSSSSRHRSSSSRSVHTPKTPAKNTSENTTKKTAKSKFTTNTTNTTNTDNNHSLKTTTTTTTTPPPPPPPTTTTKTGKKSASLTDSLLRGIVVVGTKRSPTDATLSDIIRKQDVEVYLKPARKNSKKFANFLPDKLYCSPYKYDVLVLARLDLVLSSTITIEACDTQTLVPVLPKRRLPHHTTAAAASLPPLTAPTQLLPSSTSLSQDHQRQENQNPPGISVERTRIIRSLDNETCEINCRIRFNVCSFHFSKKPFVMRIRIQTASNSNSEIDRFEYFTEQFSTFARKNDKDHDIWELISKGAVTITSSVIDQSYLASNEPLKARRLPRIIKRTAPSLPTPPLPLASTPIPTTNITTIATAEKPQQALVSNPVKVEASPRPAPRIRQRQRQQPRQQRRRFTHTMRPHKRQRLGSSDTDEEHALSESSCKLEEEEPAQDAMSTDAPASSLAPSTASNAVISTILCPSPAAASTTMPPPPSMRSGLYQSRHSLLPPPLKVASRTESPVVLSPSSVVPFKWSSGNCSMEARKSPSPAFLIDPDLHPLDTLFPQFGGAIEKDLDCFSPFANPRPLVSPSDGPVFDFRSLLAD